MNLSPNTQAILLLTAYFSKADPSDVKPLGPAEWGRFAAWLKDNGKRPDELMSGSLAEDLAGWTDSKITRDRIARLLDRGTALGIAAEKWVRSGLWVLTRSDAEYPKVLKQRLQASSPPILFGFGNQKLLSSGGIAVVGSRHADSNDTTYAERLGQVAANAGKSIVSGGARGIDEAAMLGALAAEGTAVGVLSDNLMRAGSSKKYRSNLADNSLVLISPYQPDAGFNVGNAMGRNKYIYCLSDFAVVVHSGVSGGTITGATENLRRKWVPVWVKETDDPEAGNSEIVRLGASWAPASIDDLDIENLSNQEADDARAAQNLNTLEDNREATETEELDDEPEFYELFLRKIEAACSLEPKTVDELETAFDVTKTQLNAWLKRAVEDGRLKKLTRPVRYELTVNDPQRSMFPD